MRIVCIGGGPGAVYFGLLMKKANPSHRITILERDRSDDTFGFGVVFSDATMASVAEADSDAYRAIADHLVRWDDIDVHAQGTCTRSTGHGFSGIGRHTLLRVLRTQAQALGVEFEFEHEVHSLDETGDADLVVAADGANSVVRGLLAPAIVSTVDRRANRFIWLGTDQPFAAFTFYFRENAHGLWRAHAYQYAPGRSTFIAECRDATWRAAGMDHASEAESTAYLERLFAQELSGHRLIANHSIWRQFFTVRTAPWSAGRVVLIGDAAHTAHFSVGSGTRMAMEDAIALRDALGDAVGSARGSAPGSTAGVADALRAYETARRPQVESLQRAAQASLEWFERTEQYLGLDPIRFTFSLLTRSLRITHEDLRARDPVFLARVDAAVAADAERHTGRPVDRPVGAVAAGADQHAGTKGGRPDTAGADQHAGTKSGRPDTADADQHAGTKGGRPDTADADQHAGTKGGRPDAADAERQTGSPDSGSEGSTVQAAERQRGRPGTRPDAALAVSAESQTGRPADGVRAPTPKPVDGTPIRPPTSVDPARVASHSTSDRAPVPPPMFTPFRLRDLVLRNRVVVSPMCQYVAEDGTVGDWHLVHLGSRAAGGAGLVMAEMTDVSRDARISDGCAGLYSDAHTAAWTRVVQFVHRETPAAIGIQLGHAGRKGATKRMWEGDNEPLDEGGWPVVSASALPYFPDRSPVPREMTRADMDAAVADYADAARRADEAGFDLLEIHMAHGYLLASFISPLTNTRADAYGGPLGNRMRFPLEVFDACRAVWPAHKPMSVRISAVDWAPGGMQPEDATDVAAMLKAHRCDIVDVSAGQTVPDQEPRYGRLFQTPFADRIRFETGIATMAVGNISSYVDVNTIIAAGRADLCLLARAHLFDPYWTRHAAWMLGYALPWPDPYRSVERYAPRFEFRFPGKKE